MYHSSCHTATAANCFCHSDVARLARGAGAGVLKLVLAVLVLPCAGSSPPMARVWDSSQWHWERGVQQEVCELACPCAPGPAH